METVNYKGQKISFNEDTFKFYIEGSKNGKEFASLGRAQKFIDNQYPKKPFVPFKVLKWEWISKGRSGGERKLVEVLVKDAKFVKSRRRNWDDSHVEFFIDKGEDYAKVYWNDRREEWIEDKHTRFYKIEDREAVLEADKREKAIQAQIDKLEEELRNVSNVHKEQFEVGLINVSFNNGNEAPTAEL